MTALELLAQVCDETSECAEDELCRRDISELEVVRGAVQAVGFGVVLA
jgi:hypothetical protein